MALLYAYLVRFFAVGFNPLDAGMAKIAPALGDAARVLGCGRCGRSAACICRCCAAGPDQAVLLVLVDVMKELPATLILRPFNFDTLAVEAFQLATDERLDGAALPSLVIVAVTASCRSCCSAGRSRPRRSPRPRLQWLPDQRRGFALGRAAGRPPTAPVGDHRRLGAVLGVERGLSGSCLNSPQARTGCGSTAPGSPGTRG